MIWRCPNCRDPFQVQGRTWRCLQGHSFDLAKQGYANLLLPNQKRSKEPGDNREMVLGRRAFLEQGHYSPLVEALAGILTPHLESLRVLIDRLSLLDLGCGEGYYLRALAHRLPAALVNQTDVYGLDISREAVKLAARQLPAGRLCVASSYRAPVADTSVNLALQIFAPVAETEVHRILAPEGLWLRVAPGPKHLDQLKGQLYQDVREHDVPSVPPGFQLKDSQEIEYTLQLQSSDAISSLLAMTPLAWHGSAEGRQRLIEKGDFNTQAHFVLQLMAPVNPSEMASED